MRTILQDVRYAFRLLAKTPGTTVTVMALLAVGIGANIAIFSLVNALYLKALPVPDPGRVVRIYAKRFSYGAGFSYPEYRSLRDHTATLSGLAAETQVAQLHLVVDGEAREVEGFFVTSNYASLLGLRLAGGRFFLTEEDAVPDRDPVAVISYHLWQTQFAGSAYVIGREIQVNRIPLKVIGVMPAGFGSDVAGESGDVWIPTMMMRSMGYTCEGSFDCSVLDRLVGRLADGKTIDEAQAEARAKIVWSATDAAKVSKPRQIYMTPAVGIEPASADDLRSQLRLLSAGAGALLVIACANLAGLFLARGVARRREIAVRLSLGARPRRIIRQLLTESLLLALLSGVLGLLLSFFARDWLASFYNMDSEGFLHVYDLALDWRIVAYSLLVAAASGAVMGLIPAVEAGRQELVASLKEGAGSVGLPHSSRLRQVLVCAQVALSLVLLVTAGLLARSARTVTRGTNFDPRHVVLLRLRPELLHWTAAQNESYFREVMKSIERAPGVESVTMIQGGQGLVWLWENGRKVEVHLPAQSVSPQDAGVLYHDVAPQFFATLRVPILQGRPVLEQDDAASPKVVVVNQTLARQLWPNQQAVGRSLLVGGQIARVVGVAADIQPPSSATPPVPYIYQSFWQSQPGRNGDVRMAIRVAGDPATELPKLRRLIRALNPDVPLGEDMPMTQQVSLTYMPILLAGSVLNYCGLLALCLSAVGLYSVLASSIRSRTRELGIRMALGARPRQLTSMVLREGLRVGAAGLGLGLIFSLLITRLLASWLYGVRPFDAPTFAAACLLLLAAAGLASWLPSRRAARIEPLAALRWE